MRRRWISLVTLVAMLVLPCLSTLSVEAPLPSNVATWSVLDVERWMNYTIGYAEYIPTIRLHAIDGPTLLYLSSREVEDHFNIANSIHLAKIRAHPDLRQLPVVIFSGHSEPEDLESGIALGADAYLSKPAKAEAIFATLRAVLGG